MAQKAEAFFDGLLEPGLMVFNPSQRLFWGSLLGSLLLIAVFSGRKRWQNFGILFSPKIWLHRSSVTDIKIIAINSVIRALLFSGALVSATAIAAFVSWTLTQIWGSKPQLHWPLPLMMTAFTLTIFLADDFARFFMHYLQHRWRWLWVFHQTHHSALVLTPLTLFRTHPVEILEARIRNAITYGLVTGAFFFAFGGKVTGWDILGAEALGFLFNFAGANLRHSQVWMTFGPLEKILISPAAHQVHHSRNPEHYDRNFGVCLALWDRLFGTHYDPRFCQEELQFGLVDSPLSDPKQRVWTQYAQPFRDLFAKDPQADLAPAKIAHLGPAPLLQELK